jgi:hypothetical protein
VPPQPLINILPMIKIARVRKSNFLTILSLYLLKALPLLKIPDYCYCPAPRPLPRLVDA